jgi:TPR repeat protein
VLLIGWMFAVTASADTFQDATAAYRRGDYRAALALFRPLAESGNATAQVYLGNMYREGRGVAKDDEEALKWLLKAAEQGNAGAQDNVGFMYGTGRGVARDDVQAVQWYRKAAEQGNPVAQCNLGEMYRDARGGLPQDDVQAVAWYRKAAERGSALGQRNLGEMYHQGRGVPKDDAAAAEWLQKAAKQGDDKARTLLASIEATRAGSEKKEPTAPETAIGAVATAAEPPQKDAAAVARVENSAAGQNGLVIIRVDIARLNNAGEVTGMEWASGYYIKNLKTGREYSNSSDFTPRVDALEVEEGIYCLASVKGGPNNRDLDYCLEPFFTVVAGKVNNAGWWRIGYSINNGPAFTGTVRLVYGPKYFKEVLGFAKQYQKEQLRKYGVAVGD